MIGYIKISEFGGYDQHETLEALYALNSRVCLLADEIEKKSAGKLYSVPPWIPVRMPTRANRRGYDTNDTDECIAFLQRKISELQKMLI